MVDFTYILLVIVTVAICAFGVAFSKWSADERGESNLLDGRPSTFVTDDYSADTRCELCFDSIGDERVAECPCGKVFHHSCAEPTGECPYCGKKFSEFRIRPARHIICPKCGNIIDGNICECGLVMPDRSGRFNCGCGEPLMETDTRCPKCGRTFETMVCEVNKRYNPKRK